MAKRRKSELEDDPQLGLFFSSSVEIASAPAPEPEPRDGVNDPDGSIPPFHLPRPETSAPESSAEASPQQEEVATESSTGSLGAPAAVERPPKAKRPVAPRVEPPQPYRVPLMSEIRALPWNGFNMVSTFSGCGGSCTGFELAGFKVLYANEFIPAARDTYRANHLGVYVDDRDIRLVKPEEILEIAKLKVGELDVFEGSPPCASFSTAGKRDAGWGKVKKYSDSAQRTDDLFYEYIRLLRGLMPKTFVAENVSGMIKGTAIGYFKRIIRELKASGYQVRAKLLNAQYLDVPQARQRIIFVGVRNDLELKPEHPLPKSYFYSIRDAIPWIKQIKEVVDAESDYHVGRKRGAGPDDPCLTIKASGIGGSSRQDHYVEEIVGIDQEVSGTFGGTRSVDLDGPVPTLPVGGSTGGGDSSHWKVEVIKSIEHDTSGDRSLGPLDLDKPINTINVGVNSVNSNHWKVDVEADISRHAIGREWDNVPVGESSEKYFSLVRPDPEAACPTITQLGGLGGVAGVVHPHEKRKFYISELRRLCAFPDDFELTGSYAQQWERLGRSVPPLMMMSVAATIRDLILGDEETRAAARAARMAAPKLAAPGTAADGEGQFGFFAESFTDAPADWQEYDENMPTDSVCSSCGYEWNAGEPSEEDGVEIPPDVDRTICPFCHYVEDTPKPAETLEMFPCAE